MRTFDWESGWFKRASGLGTAAVAAARYVASSGYFTNRREACSGGDVSGRIKAIPDMP
jgi:hypothetical protein